MILSRTLYVICQGSLIAQAKPFFPDFIGQRGEHVDGEFGNALINPPQASYDINQPSRNTVLDNIGLQTQAQAQPSRCNPSSEMLTENRELTFLQAAEQAGVPLENSATSSNHIKPYFAPLETFSDIVWDERVLTPESIPDSFWKQLLTHPSPSQLLSDSHNQILEDDALQPNFEGKANELNDFSGGTGCLASEDLPLNSQAKVLDRFHQISSIATDEKAKNNWVPSQSQFTMAQAVSQSNLPNKPFSVRETNFPPNQIKADDIRNSNSIQPSHVDALDSSQTKRRLRMKTKYDEYDANQMEFENSIVQIDTSTHIPIEVNWFLIEKYLLENVAVENGQVVSKDINPSKKKKVKVDESTSPENIHEIGQNPDRPIDNENLFLQSNEVRSEGQVLGSEKNWIWQKPREKLWAWIAAIPEVISQKEHEDIGSVYSHPVWGFLTPATSSNYYPPYGDSSKGITQLICRLWLLNKGFIESFDTGLKKSTHLNEQINLKNWLEAQIKLSTSKMSNPKNPKTSKIDVASQIFKILFIAHSSEDEIKFMVPQKKNKKVPVLVTKKMLRYTIASAKILMLYYQGINLKKWQKFFPNSRYFLFHLAKMRWNIEVFLSASSKDEKGKFISQRIFPWMQDL